MASEILKGRGLRYHEMRENVKREGQDARWHLVPVPALGRSFNEVMPPAID